MSNKGRYNASDEKQVNERRQQERIDAIQSRDDLKFVMGSAQGRRVLKRVMNQCGVFRSSFTGNSETFFREGARNVGLYLHGQMLDADPNQYLLILQEKLEEDSDG